MKINLCFVFSHGVKVGGTECDGNICKIKRTPVRYTKKKD